MLEAHRSALTLVRLQAIHVHTGGEPAGFAAFSQFTYDADIALHPELLGTNLTTVDAMSRVGFSRTKNPET